MICDGLSCQGSIFVSPCLACLFRLRGCGFVVPMLEVLLNGSFLGRSIFVSHGSHSTASLTALAMQCFVEGGITGMVFLLESGGYCCGRHVEMAGVRVAWRFRWKEKDA